MTAPAARMRSSPIFQFHSVRELTASGGDVNQISFAQRRECGLRHADVALHSAKQQGIALAGQALEHAAKDVAAKAGEQRLIDGFVPGSREAISGTVCPVPSRIAC